jgi:hypothetical protein
MRGARYGHASERDLASYPLRTKRAVTLAIVNEVDMGIATAKIISRGNQYEIRKELYWFIIHSVSSVFEYRKFCSTSDDEASF